MSFFSFRYFFSKIAKKFHPFKNIFVVFNDLIGTTKEEREVVRERKRGKEGGKELEREKEGKRVREREQKFCGLMALSRRRT